MIEQTKNDKNEEKVLTNQQSKDLNQSICKDLICILKEWSLITTAHGFGNVVRAQNLILKIIWILFLLFGWIYCSYLIIINIISFFNYETSTNIKIFNEVPALFPSVDICNLNPYDGQEARIFMNKIILDKNLTFNMNEGTKKYTDDITDQIKANIEESGNRNEISFWEFGFYLSQMLISCRFQGVKCNETNFTWYHNYHYGSCYRFNGFDKNKNEMQIDIKKSTKAGQNDGLQLELYVGHPLTQQQFTYKSGVRVIIHNQTVVPFPDEDGLDAGTGLQTNIAISKSFMNRLPSPYSNCVEELEPKNFKEKSLYLIIKNSSTTYNQKFCMKACQQMFLLKECNCFDLSIPYYGYDNKTGCSNRNQVTCLQNFDLKFYNSEAVNDCYENCPIECNTVNYETRISIANYPTQWYSDLFLNLTSSNVFFNQTPTFSFLKETTLMVNIFYDELSYTVVEEVPAVSFDSLIAYVGGTFGLFLGTSILSLVEILEILFLAIYSIYIKKIKKNPRNE